MKARRKRMKEEGLEKYLTPEQIRYNRNKAIVGSVWPIFRFLILFGLCFVILYPLIFMLSTAFRPNEQMNDPSVVWLPKSFTLDNIKQTWQVMKFDKTVLNTIKLNLIASVIQVCSTAITGYGFARFQFKGKKLLFAIVVLQAPVPCKAPYSGRHLADKHRLDNVSARAVRKRTQSRSVHLHLPSVLQRTAQGA